MSTIVAQTIIAKSRLPIDSRTFAIGGQMFPSTRQTALSLVPRMQGFRTILQRTSRQAFVICGVAWRLHQFLASAHVQAVTKPRSTSSAWSSSSPCQHPINRGQGFQQQIIAAMAVPRVWQEVKFSTLGVVSKDHATKNNLTNACCHEVRS